MMKKLAAVAAGLAFSAVGHAGLIVDTVEQTHKVNWFETYSYQHNLNDDGFVPGSALGGTIEIEIWDDYRNRDERWGLETILVVIEEFDFDSGGLGFGASDFFNDIGVKALAAINADGYLDVTIESLLGDFYVGDSTLTVTTADVPEPASLGLLGLGLIGLGVARKRRA